MFLFFIYTVSFDADYALVYPTLNPSATRPPLDPRPVNMKILRTVLL